MKKIGITGGIGSGKTTVCRIFERLGYSVYYADERAKWLMVNDESLINDVKRLFGENAYLSNGALNRAYIGSLVFNDKALLAKLNAIVHPRTKADALQWFKTQSQQSEKPFALKEAAILYESGSYKGVDAVIEVYAPKSIRLERVMKRDNASAETILARMDKQWPESKKIRLADFTIFNDGQHSLIKQVLAATTYFS